MSEVLLGVLIITGVILVFILYKVLKPYFIKHDTTLAITGGLGSGKTCTGVKTGVVLIRKQRFYKYYVYNLFNVKIRNFFVILINKKRNRYNIKETRKANEQKRVAHLKRIIPLKAKRKKPQLYTNFPVHYKKHIWSNKREWSKRLEAPHILCLKEMEEFSVVIIDELPQFINQFNWGEELVQKNVNEWITFFRHYVAGYLIITSQSIDDVVVQIRRKLNQCTWCFDFKKWFFGLFYTVRMCDIMLGDQVNTVSTTFIEDNTKLHFGLFPPRNTYDTRCYSNRAKNVYKKLVKEPRFKFLKTNTVLRLQKYTSPLDDKTTDQQKQEQWEKGERIWEN